MPLPTNQTFHDMSGCAEYEIECKLFNKNFGMHYLFPIVILYIEIPCISAQCKYYRGLCIVHNVEEVRNCLCMFNPGCRKYVGMLFNFIYPYGTSHKQKYCMSSKVKYTACFFNSFWSFAAMLSSSRGPSYQIAPDWHLLNQSTA